ncbi:MAG: hypothetical protein U9N59_13675 [Campylobacterota bacterium]|nr:hypothetical protein [Campylobacterota bacterium]
MKKKKIIIHIGSGKTGSTSIQKTLYLNKKRNDAILNYPFLLDRKDNQVFRYAFCKLENTTSHMRAKFKEEPDNFLLYQKELLESFEKKTSELADYVISSEFLYLSKKDEVSSIKEYLTKLGFESFHIILYIRQPSSYYLSAVQQSLKTSSFIPSPKSFDYNFKDVIAIWKDVFKNLTIRVFDKEKLVNQNVVEDFSYVLNTLGYDTNLGQGLRVNEKVSVECSQVMQDYFKSINLESLSSKELHNIRLIIASFIKKYADYGSKPILRENIKQFIINNFYEDILYVNNKYNLQLNVNEKIFTQEPKVSLFKDLATEFDEKIYKELKEVLFLESY